MPEKVFERIRNNILKQWKCCFFSAVLIGLLAHFYKITNWLPNWDSLVFRYDSQNMISLGRWFLPVVCSLSSFYDLPLFNGILCIIFHALGAVCICEILKVKENVTAILIGAVTVTFPTVTSVMMYNYVADGYAVAFFLSCLAAYYLTCKRPKYISAILLIAFSSGIYQAYITVTVMLILISLADRLVFHKEDMTSLATATFKILISGVAGIVLYYVVLKLLLMLLGTELLAYQGVSSSFDLSAINIPASLYVVKNTFTKCFFDFSRGINVFTLINVVIFAVTLAACLIYAVKTRLILNPLKLVFLALICILLPVGSALLAFVNAGVDYHNLMRMGYMVWYLFFIILYERTSNKDEKLFVYQRWIVLAFTAVLVCNQVIIANVAYHKAQVSYEKTYGVLIRIDDRIEQTISANKCDEILVIGGLQNSDSYGVNLPPDITGVSDGYIIRADDETVQQSILCSALNDYCEKDFKFVSGDRKKALLEKEEVKNMGVWPFGDCVKVVDDVVVIKLESESE